MKLEKTVVFKTTLNCNLRCCYCYEFNRINDSILNYNIDYIDVERIIKRFSILFPESKINWLFHGGEPLLNGYEFYKHIIDLIKYINIQNRSDYKISIQTNGTLIDDDLIKLLEDNLSIFGDRVLSISIDGPKFIDDKARMTKHRKSIHNIILNSLNKINKSNIDFTTISVVGQHNVNNPKEVFDFLYSINPNFVKLIPCYNFNKEGRKYNLGISPIEYSNFMRNIFDMWMQAVDRDEERFVIDPIMTIISTLTNSLSTWCEYRYDKCNHFTTIYPNGDMYLCDNYNRISMKEYAFIGNIYTITDNDLINSMLYPNLRCKYNDFYNSIIDDCKVCEINNYCRGGCIEQRNQLKNISYDLYQEYCFAKKELISYIKNAVDHALS